MDSVRASISPALAERYSIERELGSGAMALVFLAHDLKHDRWVAIKVLKPDVATAIGSDRFHREIEVVGGLTHPHILPLYDSGEAGGLLYFVMPHVEGESLRDRLTREKRVPMAESTRIAREVSDALGFAHGHGVVHRDVKPANIMLSAGHAQLADFGIAHLLEGAEATLTGTGITVGTPAYMSPEQVSGDEALDGRSDIYSLGCVLYEMLCGHPPFADGSRRAVLVHQMLDAAPDIREECPEVPLELVGIVKTALDKEPAKRFASAAEMSAALASVRSSIDVTAGARIRRALKRRGRKLKSWQQVALIAAFILLAIGGPAIVDEVFRSNTEVLAGEDPRGTYMPAPFERTGQTALEDSLVELAADRLASMLDGWDRVDATRRHDLAGTMHDLGIEGSVLGSLDDALLLARSEGIGTVVGLLLQLRGDTLVLETLLYDAASGDRLGTLKTTRAPSGDLEGLVWPVAAEILDTRGENPELLLAESSNQDAWQEYYQARDALYGWRLAEAEAGFRRAIDEDPGFARAHHYLAVTLFWQTSRDVERRRALIPQIQRVSGTASRLAADADLNPGLEAGIEGLRAFSIGDYEAAREQFHGLIESDSTDTEAWLFLGAVESADPWLASDSDPPRPRGDINLARRAFDYTSRRWPEAQISRGMHFEISEDLADHLINPSCPMFITRADMELIPPYTDPLDAEWFALFPRIEADTIAWADCKQMFEGLERAEARAAHRETAEHLYDESIAEIERWTRYAPDHARPREEWADMVSWWHSRQDCAGDTTVTRGLAREALGHLEAALSLSPDTTPQQMIKRALLRLAVGQAGPVETARAVDAVAPELEESGSGIYAAPSWTAANAYMAAGQPAKAIERMRGLWSIESRSAVDPAEEDEVYYDYGDVFQALGEIRVLGAVGYTGPELAAATTAVDAEWTDPGRRARARAVLRQSSVSERARSADIRPAVALDRGMGALWFSEWDDLEENRAPLWRAFLAVNDQPDSAAIWLDEAVERLERMYRPFPTDYFLHGLLAQRLGEHETAAGLFGRMQECPLSVASLDVGWGLTTLARLYRARSLEALGRNEEAVSEYARVVSEWADAEPEVHDKVEEARQGVARLSGGVGDRNPVDQGGD